MPCHIFFISLISFLSKLPRFFFFFPIFCSMTKDYITSNIPIISHLIFCQFCLFFLFLPNAEQVNLAYSITWLEPEINISLRVKYLYLSILHNDNADIFAASLLILPCSFSPIISWLVVMVCYLFFLRDFSKLHWIIWWWNRIVN